MILSRWTQKDAVSRAELKAQSSQRVFVLGLIFTKFNHRDHKGGAEFTE